MKKIVSAVLLLVLSISNLALAEESASKVNTSMYYSRLQLALQNFENGRYDKAFPVLQNFATAGEKSAQYLTGLMLFNGIGTEQSPIEGYAWMMVANEQRSKLWADNLEKAGSALPEDARARAEELGNQFIANYGVDTQRLRCSNEKVTGSNRRRHVCEKIEVQRGYLYVDEDFNL